MAGLAGHLDGEAVSGSRTGACHHGNAAHIHLGTDMDAEDEVHTVQTVLLDYSLGASADLLRGLEQQLDSTAQLILDLHQHLGSAHQHGGMGIMSAGMHESVILGGKGKPGLFRDAQRVDVRTQRDGLARLAALDLRNQSGRLEPAIGNPQFVHFLGDLLCGAELLEARLRMLVKIPAKCHYFRLYSLCHCSKIHIKPSLVLLAAENRYLLFPCKNIAFIVAR